MLSALFLAMANEMDPQWVPTAQNFRQIQRAIQPSPTEDRWKAIGWRNQFWPAVQEARKLGRPILLWTMNGHPIGCT